MRAYGAYRLIVRKSGRAPALLADHKRVDHVEVVDVDSGEVVLFWDCPPRRAKQLARAIREEMRELEADQFLSRWSAAKN